jgi:uncharacterized protein (DUF433 family)
MNTLLQPDWSQYPDAEGDDATMSGAWRLKGTRIRVQDVLDNAIDQTSEEIAREVYPSLTIERVRGVVAFAGTTAHAHHFG